jgi:uncharacterized membrane protein YhaH (DUF805 family)
MGALRWPIGRASRNTMFAWLVLSSIAFTLIDWFAFRRLDLTINLGFRFNAIEQIGFLPVWRVALEVAFDVALATVAVARLHDASYSARWLAAILALTAASLLPGAGSLAFVALIAWVAIIFLPPSVGPNRFGADPRGWTSREHFDAQQRDLSAQEKQ